MGTFSQKYYLAVAVAVVVFAIGAIQGLGPDTLGISPLVARWLSLVTSVLGFVAAMWLPRVTKPGEPLSSDLQLPPASAGDLLHAAATTVDVPPAVPAA